MVQEEWMLDELGEEATRDTTRCRILLRIFWCIGPQLQIPLKERLLMISGYHSCGIN